MKMKLSVLALALGSMLATGAIMAAPAKHHDMDPKMYFGMTGGVSMPSNIKFTDGGKEVADLKTGYNLGAALGYRYNPNLRFDLTFDFTHNKLLGKNGTKYHGETAQYHILVNGYYDMQVHDTLVPYVGAGIGYADFSIFDQSGNHRFASPGGGLGYQLAVGVNYKWHPNVMLGVGYRALGTHIDKHANIGEGTLFNSVVGATLTYTFNSL